MANSQKPVIGSNQDAIAVASLSELASAFSRLAVAFEAFANVNSGTTTLQGSGTAVTDASSSVPAVAAAVSLSQPEQVPTVLAVATSSSRNENELPPPVYPSQIDECIVAALLTGEFQLDPNAAPGEPSAATPSAPPPGPVSNGPTPTEIARRVAHIPDQGQWYLVTQGREPGVYRNWAETSPLVTGVSCAIYTRSGSKAEALSGYREAWLIGRVVRRI